MNYLEGRSLTRRSALAVMASAALGTALDGIPLAAEVSTQNRLGKLLPGFSDKSKTLLAGLLDQSKYSGQIPASEVAILARNEAVTVENLMLALLPLSQSYARAPISNFYVGVVVQGVSGSLYTGANIEIPGQCLGFAVHAEQSALSNAYMHGEQAVIALAVGGAPCGHCRQFIDEMSPDGEIMILTPDQPPRKLSAILPAAFGPAALGMKNGAFPVPETALKTRSKSPGALELAALEAARRSYAPYSKSPAGVALRSTGGRIHRGSYIENVAFNPSLSPLQVALAAMIAAGEDHSRISGATLVELSDAKISQRAVTETVLAALAPHVKLEVVLA